MSLLDPTFEYTPALRARYEEEGYLIFPSFLSPDGLRRCQDASEVMLKRLHAERPPEMILSAHVTEPWLFELACEPRLLDIVQAYVGPNILLWNSHLIFKPPGEGRSIPWHQDETYFNIKGRYPPTFWIPLDRIDEENGGLTVLPGRHLDGLVDVEDSGRSDFDQTMPSDAFSAGTPEVGYRMQPGQLAMHSPRMPHYSPNNTSDRWRRVITLHYVDAEAELATRTYRNFRTDEPFERKFFLVRGTAPEGTSFPRSPATL